MTFVTTEPEALSSAARDLASIGTMVHAESAAAATPTTALAPAASDEVSAVAAAQFSAFGHLYQSIIAQATAVHEQFVSMLNMSAGSYAAAEAANVAAAG